MHIPEPAISRKYVIKGAGIFWIIGGLFLLYRAFNFNPKPDLSIYYALLIAVIFAFLKSKYVFIKVVKKNISRIEAIAPHKDKICVFAFQSFESYLLIIIMIFAGIYLRKTNLPAVILQILFLAIGFSLLFSSLLYLKWKRHQ